MHLKKIFPKTIKSKLETKNPVACQKTHLSTHSGLFWCYMWTQSSYRPSSAKLGEKKKLVSARTAYSDTLENQPKSLTSIYESSVNVTSVGEPNNVHLHLARPRKKLGKLGRKFDKRSFILDVNWWWHRQADNECRAPYMHIARYGHWQERG